MHGIHGFPVALAAITFSIAAGLWSYRKLHRVTAWGFGLAAFFLAAGLTPWTDALASLVATGAGITVLVIVAIVGGFGFHFEAILKHQHHRIRTPVIAVTFGTAIVLTIGSLSRLLRKAAESPSKTSDALGSAISRIQSGKAAHAVPAGHGLFVLAIGAAVLMALIMFGHKMENRRKGGGRGMIPAAARPAGRPALPAGRGRRP